MSEEYNPFLDESSTPQEEEFIHVDQDNRANHPPENGAVSRENYNENVIFVFKSPVSCFTFIPWSHLFISAKHKRNRAKKWAGIDHEELAGLGGDI